MLVYCGPAVIVGRDWLWLFLWISSDFLTIPASQGDTFQMQIMLFLTNFAEANGSTNIFQSIFKWVLSDTSIELFLLAGLI